jgi:phage shock protein C
MTKRLYRSQDNQIFAGVMGGLGEYFDVDPVLIRLLYVMATIFTGLVPGVLCYIIAVAIVPKAPRIPHSNPVHSESVSDDSTAV